MYSLIVSREDGTLWIPPDKFEDVKAAVIAANHRLHPPGEGRYKGKSLTIFVMDDEREEEHLRMTRVF